MTDQDIVARLRGSADDFQKAYDGEPLSYAWILREAADEITELRHATGVMSMTIESLRSERDLLEKRVATAVKALRFYASGDHLISVDNEVTGQQEFSVRDLGAIACEALRSIGAEGDTAPLEPKSRGEGGER